LFFSLARTRREIARLSRQDARPDEEMSDVAAVAAKLKMKPSDVIDMHQRLEWRDVSLGVPIGDGSATHLESNPSGGDPQDEVLARSEEEALIAHQVRDVPGAPPSAPGQGAGRWIAVPPRYSDSRSPRPEPQGEWS
jgi:RNA polymerase sigma-32 factor